MPIIKKQGKVCSCLVGGRTPLTVGNAAAAIIIVENGQYLLQLRDEIESIWYPGHWGCFGGSVDPGEDPLAALKRELQEELDFEAKEPCYFTELNFDLGELGLDQYYRKYYIVTMTTTEMTHLRLGEGEAVAAFDGDTVLGELKVTPYDAFALFLHSRAFRMGRLKYGEKS